MNGNCVRKRRTKGCFFSLGTIQCAPHVNTFLIRKPGPPPFRDTNGVGYIVLEGNHRLGAVRLILSPKMQGELRVSIPAMDRAKLDTLGSLLIREVGSRTPTS